MIAAGVKELHWLADVIIALSRTGLRISELASLMWADVDIERNMIVLTDESTQAPRRRGRNVREIKNSRGRSFPIHADFREVLLRIPRGEGILVFFGPRGGVLKPDTLRRILVRDVLSELADRFPTAKGQIGCTDGRLHSFRHFFCLQSANSGIPEQVVMDWLGHRSSRMVHRYYHLHDDEAQRQMKRLSFVEATEAGANRSAG